MIEQHDNQILLTFPNPEAARAFAQFLTTLTDLHAVASSAPPSAPPPRAESDQPSPPPTPPSSPSIQDSPAPEPSPAPGPGLEPEPEFHSRRTLLTDDRLEQLYQQRQSGQTAHQRLLRAQTTLRDGTLPFSRATQQPPPPSGQPSPRQKAQEVGGFADGSGAAPEPRKPSRLRPVLPTAPLPSPKP